MRVLRLPVIVALLFSVLLNAAVSASAQDASSNHRGSRDRLLVLCKDSIRAFDLATGADLGEFLSKESTGGKIWGLDTIAERDGLLYIGTYYGDGTQSTAFPGAVQVFTCKGKYVRQFDSGFSLQRPYGLEFIPSISPADSSRHGNSGKWHKGQQLVVAGLGNDALVLYNGKTGQFEGFLAQGDNTTASPMGPNGMLLLGRTLFLATEGSVGSSGTIEFPSWLKSALLAIDIDTKEITLVDAPGPSPNAGYTSLLGIALLPRDADIGVTSSSARHGGRNDDKNVDRVIVVSDYAGGLRYYSTSPPYPMIKIVDTTFIDPVTNKLTTLNYGSVRVAGRYIYLAAFDSSKATLDGMVLRYKFDGTPAGATSGPYAGTPVWIGPSAELTRAIGLKVLGKGCKASFGKRP